MSTRAEQRTRSRTGIERARMYDLAATQAGCWCCNVPWDIFELLIDLDPARALRLLRKSQPREIRRWKDDWDAARLLLAARAYERLGRSNRAFGLYGLAAAAGRGTEAARTARAAMQRLRPGGGR